VLYLSSFILFVVYLSLPVLNFLSFSTMNNNNNNNSDRRGRRRRGHEAEGNDPMANEEEATHGDSDIEDEQVDNTDGKSCHFL
jgi:hypothetical protein